MRRRAPRSCAASSWPLSQLRGLAGRIGEFTHDDLTDLAPDLRSIHVRAAEMDAVSSENL
jgi:hypothetical protein